MGELLSDSTIIKAVKGQVSANLQDEAVILSLTNDVYYGLNPVGARIWQLIQQPISVGAVREAILAEYEVEAARCELDIAALIAEFKTQGLIELSEPTTP